MNDDHRRGCVFCGKPNLSKEHIWPRWLTKRGALPHAIKHNQDIIYSGDGEQVNFRRLIKNGAIHQRRLRIVCVDCNIGWMSNIVEAARPIADDLINDRNRVLSVPDQTKLSSFIAISFIIAEFTDLPTRSIPDQDLRHLMQSGTPPLHWTISVGRHEGEDPSAYRHFGFRAYDHAEVRAPQVPAYGQVSTVYFGAMILQAASSTLRTFAINYRANGIPAGFQQIWPATGNIHWPAELSYHDDTIDLVNDDFVWKFSGR